MKAGSGTVQGANDALLFQRTWRSRGEPAAVVVLVHGIGEHSGRYEHVGRFLADHGLEVYAYDHRGHGRSSGAIGWIERFEDFLDDLQAYLQRVLEENPKLPLFLLGHSMGGLIATAYVLERAPKPDFLVLSGPAIAPIIDPSDKRIDPTRLSKDPAVWEAYLSDPLVLRERVTDDLYARLADGLMLLVGRSAEIDLPVLLIHGSDDRHCSAEGAKAYLEASSSPDLTVKLYPEGLHEMLNETNKDEVLADLWAWIEARLAAPPSAG